MSGQEDIIMVDYAEEQNDMQREGEAWDLQFVIKNRITSEYYIRDGKNNGSTKSLYWADRYPNHLIANGIKDTFENPEEWGTFKVEVHYRELEEETEEVLEF